MLKLFPHEFQMDSKDCGPACLKIISKYYGKYYKMQKLRQLCGITREGVSFYDLSEAAEKMGFRTRCYSVNWDQLINKIPLPCILHWNSNHFIVAYKVKRGNIYVSDPSVGRLKYSRNEFMKRWLDGESLGKGKVIALEPTPSFFEIKSDADEPLKKNLFGVLSYFYPYRKSIQNLLLVMLLITGLQSVLPFISKAVIDVGIQTNDIAFINLILAANITIIFSMLIGNGIRDWILLNITSRVNIALVSDYLIKLMRLPISFFEAKLVGDILQRANDHERVRNFIMHNSLNLIFASITFLVFSIVLFSFHPVIFAIFFGGNTIFALWVLSALRIRKKFDWQNFEISAKDQSYWVETISNMQEIKTNNFELHRRWAWETIQAQLFRINQRLLILDNVQNTGAQFISSLTNLFITFYCAKAVIEGEITFGVMISTQFIIGMLNGPVGQFIIYIQSYQYAKFSYDRLNEIHELENEEGPESGIKTLELPQFKSLLVKNLSFQYGANSPLILRNVSFIIPEKCITAIVGDSGSGKSTLLKLLLRLYQPTLGEIKIGNLNISNVDLKLWRDRCASVMQDGKIFNDTILNNIILNDEKVDYDKLKVCVNAANIIKDIEEFPLGYNTLLGELGRGLSGGQKQRLLIARALYREPDYLFLDEATNSLDSMNEKKIVQALDNIFIDKTVVIVAHRLSTIQRANQIVVLSKGRVVEIGNHKSLMEKKGHYFKLVISQLDYQENG